MHMNPPEIPAFTGFSQNVAVVPRICGNASRKDSGAPRCARLPPVKRTVAAMLSALALLLAAAPSAPASSGAGLAGPVTDKTITFFCFGVIAFFATLVIVLSLIQNRLEKRKDQRRSDLARFN